MNYFLFIPLLLCCAPALSAPAGDVAWQAREITPLKLYLILWERTEQCLERKGPFYRTRWFIVPDSVPFYLYADKVLGVAIRPERATSQQPEIYLKQSHMNNHDVIRHEIVHIIIVPRGHPVPPYNTCAPLTIPERIDSVTSPLRWYHKRIDS